jgi:hypothetical protein
MKKILPSMISKHVKFRIETAGGSLAKYLRKVLFEPSTKDPDPEQKHYQKLLLGI